MLPNRDELLESLRMGLLVEEELTDQEYVALFGRARPEPGFPRLISRESAADGRTRHRQTRAGQG